jgi:hypothetical protein
MNRSDISCKHRSAPGGSASSATAVADPVFNKRDLGTTGFHFGIRPLAKVRLLADPRAPVEAGFHMHALMHLAE